MISLQCARDTYQLRLELVQLGVLLLRASVLVIGHSGRGDFAREGTNSVKNKRKPS